MFGLDPQKITQAIKDKMDKTKSEEWQDGYITGAKMTLEAVNESVKQLFGGK